MSFPTELSHINSREIQHAETLLAGSLPSASKFEEKFSEKSLDFERADDDYGYPDGGTQAWLCVFGCFLMSCACMGYGMMWGAIQDYYHTVKYPDVSLTSLSLVGGCFNFAMNSSSYVGGRVGDRYGYKRVIAISCCLSYLCLLITAFTNQLWQVYLVQGVLFGLSQGIALPLYMALPSRWFLKRRGLATGMTISGAGIGGGIESLYIRPMFTNLGFRNTMLIYSAIHACVWVIAFFLMTERPLPPSVHHLKRRWLPQNIGPQFYSVAITVFIGVFGYLTPYYLLSTYTRTIVPDLDSTSLLIVVPLTVMSFSAGLGRITAGKLADFFGPVNCFFASFFLGGLLQMAFWTFAKTYGTIVAFAILNGFFGCWFFSLLPVVCAKLFGVDNLATYTGFMVLVNSPGQLAGPSIASALLAASGQKWWTVSLYSGGVSIVGAVCVLYARFSYDQRFWVAV